MSTSGTKARRGRLWRYLLIAGACGLLLAGGLAWYATTDSFQAMVRYRLVAELQRVTGGRVDLGSVHTVPFRLLVDVRDLTIHGREGPTEVPYAHVDRLLAKINPISVLGGEFGFHSLVLDRPVVHVIFYPDGTTNQPKPGLNKASSAVDVQQLFALSIGRLEIRHGEMLWNDEKIPLDLVANDVSANVDYSVLHRRYSGDLLLGKIETKFQSYRPLAWMAEAHFVLGEDSLELQSLKATSGRSRLQASGQLVNFRQPAVTGEYALTLDLAEAGAIVRHPEMRHGALQAAGRGSWSAAQFSSAGKLQLKDFDWQDETLSLRAAGLSSGFSVNSQRLELSDIRMRLLGGEASGNAQVANWLRSSTPSNALRNKAADEQKGSIRLRFQDLSAGEIARALSSSARPLLRMNLAGSASGTVETRWKGSPHSAEAEIALDVSPPTRPSPTELPLTAHAHATYRGALGELEVSDLSASTRETQVRASGTLSKHAALKLHASTGDVGEWAPVLGALGYPERMPMVLHGRGSFNGTASGSVTEIEVAGKLQSSDLDLLIPGRQQQEKQIHWDSLAADVQLSPSGFITHHGTLQRGDTRVSFDLNVGLDKRQFTPSSLFTAKVRMHAADLDEILALTGHDYPASGKVDLLLQASGTRSSPQGQGEFHVSGAMIRGEPVRHLDCKFTFQDSELSLDQIHLAHYDAQVSGSGTYDLSSGSFRFNLKGSNFDLARFPGLQAGGMVVAGRMDFDAESSGTFQEPVIDATIRLHDLSFDRQPAGEYTFNAVTQGSELRLNGRSQFNQGELDVDGKVHLREDWPAKIDLRFNHLNVNPVLAHYLRGRVTGPSMAAGDLQLQGPLRNLGELQVNGEISDFIADVEHIQVRNNGPVRFVLADQVLQIKHLRLIGQGTDLEVSGTVNLSGERELNLQAEGHADLALMHSFDPDFTSSGEVAGNLTLGGTLARPATQGRVQVVNGSIQYGDLPSALSDINGSLVFNQDRLQIESLTARAGGGQVTFGGYATAYHGQPNFDLTLQGQDVRLRYPPGVSSMTNVQLRWMGTPAASTLSGDATITKLAVTPGFDFASYLERTAQSAALPQTSPLLSSIRMDVHIVTTPELQMQTASLRLSGDADLRLRGTAAKPVLLGRADVIEGAVYFNGTKYRMERGDVSFVNPVSTTPVLDLQASTHVRDYDITVNLNGQLDKLNLSYHSEPPLPTADIISLLALGQTQEQSARLQQSGQSPFVQQASSAVLAEAINSALSNRSQRLFGISHIKIDPQGLNTETTPTQASPLPAVTIEQQVRDNITLTYTTDVAQRSQQIIQGEYNITRNLSVVGIRDYNGVVSFEVRLRRRKK